MPNNDQTKQATQNGASKDLYVFISYAREDWVAARKIKDFLTAEGIRVFIDTRDIKPGADWPLTIHHALEECNRMVLVLSSMSMPYRKEVHYEWISFDRQRKPIYPICIEECELLYRLHSYNYIDARHGLEEKLKDLAEALRGDFQSPEPMTNAERFNVVKSAGIEERTLPAAFQALYDAVLDPAGNVVLTDAQAEAIKDHEPVSLKDYRLARITEWSLPRYYLDRRFVNLTLMLDKGETEPQRWQRAEDFRFDDLREVLNRTADYPALVLLGAPGSGKSTLLRRVQLDHSVDRLRDNQEQVSFFVQLNGYHARGDSQLSEPREWLNRRWAARYRHLPPLDDYLRNGRALLLLDALNEMPHQSVADYHRLVGLWKEFALEAAGQGNRLVFSCRSLDYSASLSSHELRVPQVEVQPMNAEQMRAFLRAYIPGNAERVWAELEHSIQYSLFQTPYFLKLLCEQVEISGMVSKGRASLFTGFVRQVLARECEKNDELFQPDTLLDEKDHRQLTRKSWLGPYDLPERGVLIPRLCDLAYSMQIKGLETEGAQVRIGYHVACGLMAHERAGDIVKAGLALNVLDEDDRHNEIAFFHQLLQEYFAARRLAGNPNPTLTHVEWAVDRVGEKLETTLAGMADGDPLPPLPQTGWEETTVTAAPMAENPGAFIRDLIEHNLPLAARCAASPEIQVDEKLKREIQDRLIVRTQDMQCDLRARIAAGEALGIIGDPRFQLRKGPYGNYLLPPLAEIPRGTYPIGDRKSDYGSEKPEHEIVLETFQIGQFPVTNAEYKCFIDAGGYENEQWWDTEESLAWLRGEAGTEGSKQSFREYRQVFINMSEHDIFGLVQQNRITTMQAQNFIALRNMTEEQFEQWLNETFPTGKTYRRPEFWDDSRFNNPAQPVVGVTWFEARAYCNWLTANAAETGIFRLPTEVEYEAAARGNNRRLLRFGRKGRMYPYGDKFDVKRGNTFESHIRRTTPVGVFDNATPEKVYDLSGNAWTWTSSIYDEARFPYPYRNDDGREDVNATGVRRVLRGGSWDSNHGLARAVFRDVSLPLGRYGVAGFRVVVWCGPPSLNP